MSYFSSRATWLSLVESPEVAANLKDPKDDTADFSPSTGWDPPSDLFESEADPSSEEIVQLEIMCDLRHRLFFHHGEREFGPSLLMDTLRLARAQTDSEEAVMWYCRARQIAQNLVEVQGEPGFNMAWIEIDKILAELQSGRGNDESSAMYAREGLDIIKRNRFGAESEARITEWAVRLFRILGRDR